MWKNRSGKIDKTTAHETRFCCNPFGKTGHSTWRRTKNLTTVTNKLVADFLSIGCANVPNITDKICTTCRLKVSHLMKKDICEVVEVTENELEKTQSKEVLIATSSMECFEGNSFDNMSKVLLGLGIQTAGVRELRRDSLRVQLFQQAVDALKQLMNVDCPVYYQDKDVPVVKDIINSYRISSKSEQFQILTLLASSWSKQKLMTETGCSKYAFIIQNVGSNYP